MNKKTIKALEKRILRRMMAAETELKQYLKADTAGVPDRQLDGLMVRIEELCGKITADQNRLMFLQEISEE